MDCAERVVQLLPHDYTSHRNLAELLLRQERFAEAVSHIQWCLARSPDNGDLQKSLELARSGPRGVLRRR